MNKDLTEGPVMKSMLLFAVPMILGNLLQQCYNVADTLIVGQFLGKNALAAVGSSFTLMTFLTSILLGLCMGSGALFSSGPRPWRSTSWRSPAWILSGSSSRCRRRCGGP